jgi:ectoine hydroxylase-related dioxygenase (phytanoyl-CoA dioxygenase family)
MTSTTANHAARQEAARLSVSDCRIEDLAAIVQVDTRAADYPLASGIARGIVVYDCAALRAKGVDRDALMAEWARAWRDGPGVLVLKNAFEDLGVLDRVSARFQTLIEEGRASGTGADHFAKPGANDRVWNALEKLCVKAPEDFAAYYGNAMLALACEAWLGPAYQITSQVNCVNPGGAAQMPHRDYHLGFLTPQQAERFPSHVHAVSPFLTLQGAVAHVDMPLQSGPTLYLPHSQKYLPGYLVAGRPDFAEFFDKHHVQLPLEKGDAVFFNPALMHAAGTNRTTNVYRLANLLQVSSAFGRAMESVDRVRMSRALYPALLKMQAAATVDAEQVQNAVAACAEGYAFPTNLDLDPPLGGLAPESQQSMMLRALQERWAFAAFDAALQAQANKKLTTDRRDA